MGGKISKKDFEEFFNKELLHYNKNMLHLNKYIVNDLKNKISIISTKKNQSSSIKNKQNKQNEQISLRKSCNNIKTIIKTVTPLTPYNTEKETPGPLLKTIPQINYKILRPRRRRRKIRYKTKKTKKIIIKILTI